jgi:subtilisin-like proprotein convertase family protein
MKKIITLFLLFLMIGTFSTNAQTFSGDSGPIPDNACPTTTPYSVAVTGVGILGTTNILDEVSIDITHTWNSDLQIFLVAPDGTTQLELSTNNGGSGDNYTNTVFRDDAATSITAGTSPFTGTFLPEGGLLSSFSGVDADGVWSLAICDGASGDTGTVNSFDISFAPAPVTPPNCDSTLTATTDVSIAGDISWTAATGGPTA